MVTVEEAAELAAGFPGVSETTSYGNRAWSAGGKGAKHFAWVRPFSKADLKRFGDDPVPPGDILAVRVEDLGEKEAVLASQPKGFFTIPHFDGFAAVLICLERATTASVREALEDGWLACAPADAVSSYLAGRPKG